MANRELIEALQDLNARLISLDAKVGALAMIVQRLAPEDFAMMLKAIEVVTGERERDILDSAVN